MSEDSIKKESVSRDTQEVETIDLIDVAKFISQKTSLFAVQKLRKGPIKNSTFEKLLKARFARLKLDAKALILSLNRNGFIKFFEIETQKDDNNSGKNKTKYICLIRDYVAIRRPPIQVYDLIDQGVLPRQTQKQYQKMLQDYFKKYSKRPSIGDDPEVYKIFMDENLTKIVQYLTKNIIPIKNPPKDIVMAVGGIEKFKNYLKNLVEKNVIYLGENPKDKSNPWIILLTDIELQEIFPEYLIDGVASQLRDELIDKDVAIRALNILKNAYVKNQKPRLYKRTMIKIDEEIKAYNRFIEEKNNKSALKNITQLISLFNSLGDVKKVKEWEIILEKTQI